MFSFVGPREPGRGGKDWETAGVVQNLLDACEDWDDRADPPDAEELAALSLESDRIITKAVEGNWFRGWSHLADRDANDWVEAFRAVWSADAVDREVVEWGPHPDDPDRVIVRVWERPAWDDSCALPEAEEHEVARVAAVSGLAAMMGIRVYAAD